MDENPAGNRRVFGFWTSDSFSPLAGRRWPEGPDEGRHGHLMRGSNRTRTTRARQLRKVENEAEEALWNELRGRRLNGYKFVRQLPIGPYFADFACRQSNLVVEVDGSQHQGKRSDRLRDETMNINGWSVVRFWHVDVLRDRKSVLETILAVLDGRLKERTIASDVKFLPAKPER